MPIYVQYGSIAGIGGKGRVVGIKHGTKNLTQVELANWSSFKVQSPRDAATGLASGKRQHSPLVIIKESEPSTPLFFKSNNQLFSNLTLYFKKTDPQGKEQPYFTITLTNATVSAPKRYQPHPHHPEPVDSHELEELQFVFEKIVYTNVGGKISGSDDWLAGS